MNGIVNRPSTFELGLQVVKSLQDGLGAVVSDYQVDPRGMLRITMGVRPRSWEFRIAMHSFRADHVDRFLQEAHACLAKSREHHETVNRYLRGIREHAGSPFRP
jgi:hypothetical protein